MSLCHSILILYFHLFAWPSLREWFLNGNFLIIIVSALIILPLSLMKQLGTFFILSSLFSFYSSSLSIRSLPSILVLLPHHSRICPLSVTIVNHSFHCNPGYLGYTSGFSLSCMVFFLISVSICWWSKSFHREHNQLLLRYWYCGCNDSRCVSPGYLQEIQHTLPTGWWTS